MSVANDARFYLRYMAFSIREPFSDLASGIVGFLLFPFFIWLISMVWGRFNAYQGHYTLAEVMLYLGATEILFMTFLRSSALVRSSADFSLTLARPRSWLGMQGAAFFGSCLGNRIVYLAIAILVLPLLGVPVSDTLVMAGRLMIFFPLLGLIQVALNLGFACAHVLWSETSYLMLPFSKVFLALGGVFGPLVDYGEPWRGLLLKLPPADLFFQPAHFCVKGSFYETTPEAWLLRVLAFTAVLFAFDLAFFRYAKRRHQSYGG